MLQQRASAEFFNTISPQSSLKLVARRLMLIPSQKEIYAKRLRLTRM